MNNPFQKKKPSNPFALKLHQTQKKVRWLKIRLFLLFTLPIAVITIGKAVLKEYIRIRIRQAAGRQKAPDLQDNSGNKSAKENTTP